MDMMRKATHVVSSKMLLFNRNRQNYSRSSHFTFTLTWCSRFQTMQNRLLYRLQTLSSRRLTTFESAAGRWYLANGQTAARCTCRQHPMRAVDVRLLLKFCCMCKMDAGIIHSIALSSSSSIRSTSQLGVHWQERVRCDIFLVHFDTWLNIEAN